MDQEEPRFRVRRIDPGPHPLVATLDRLRSRRRWRPSLCLTVIVALSGLIWLVAWAAIRGVAS